MKFCTKCLMPETKPNLSFDKNGVCDACNSQNDKNQKIDWDARKAQFLEIIKENKKHPVYDCVVGVSGGKDSHFIVLKCLELGLNPLCVCFEPSAPTKIGRKNLANLNNLGVDLIHIKQNPQIYRKLAVAAFRATGDNEWQNHVGIFCSVPRIAVNFGVPLIIWGENPQLEYGGPATAKDDKTIGKAWLERFGGMLGKNLENIAKDAGVDPKLYYFHNYPSDAELARVGVTGLFLGYFFKWDYRENLRLSKKYGFKESIRNVETTYETFENLDCYSNHLHDYLKYLKYGFSRATDNACIDIRLGLIDREQGKRLVAKYEGKPPKKAIKKYLDFSGLSRAEFEQICDSWTNREIFETDNDGKIIKDFDGSPVRKIETILK